MKKTEKKTWGASESASFPPHLSRVIDAALQRELVHSRSEALREGITLFAEKYGISIVKPTEEIP
jgi:Arc/MetJ-type ribon-helix-helix transcriptional regulator